MQQMHRELLIQVCTMARSENKDAVIIEDSDEGGAAAAKSGSAAVTTPPAPFGHLAALWSPSGLGRARAAAPPAEGGSEYADRRARREAHARRRGGGRLRGARGHWEARRGEAGSQRERTRWWPFAQKRAPSEKSPTLAARPGLESATTQCSSVLAASACHAQGAGLVRGGAACARALDARLEPRVALAVALDQISKQAS